MGDYQLPDIKPLISGVGLIFCSASPGFTGAEDAVDVFP